MVKEYYFARTICGGAKLVFIGDFNDIEDFEKIREFVKQMNADIAWEESEDCSERKTEI